MLILFIVCMLFCFAAWLSGWTIARIFRQQHHISLTDTMMGGLVLLNLVFSLFSLVLPLITVLFASILAVLLLVNMMYVPALFKMLRKNSTNALLMLPVAFLICLVASDAPVNYDSGLYHIQTIKWINEFAVIPGLGNLHGRLAFNPQVFTLMAGLSFADLAGFQLYPVNAATLIIFSAYLIRQAGNPINRPLSVQLFVLLAGTLTIAFAMPGLSSPTPDTFVLIMSMFILMRWMDTVGTDVASELIIFIRLLLAWMALYMFTVKLSALMLLIVPIFILFFFWRNQKWSIIGFFFLGACFILLPWLVRSYFLSGYLIYPIVNVDIFHVDWKIPIQSVVAEQSWIKAWAWLPHTEPEQIASMPHFELIIKWFSRHHPVYKVFLIVAFSGFLPYLWFSRNRLTRPCPKGVTSIIGIAYAGIIFWFIVAPDIRFAMAYLIIAASAWIFLATHPILSKWVDKVIAGYIRYILLAGICTMLISYAWLRHCCPFASLIIPVTPDRYHQMYFFDGLAFQKKEVNNLQIIMPVSDDRCFDLPLPCTPYYNEHLRMRGPNISEGFLITSLKQSADHE